MTTFKSYLNASYSKSWYSMLFRSFYTMDLVLLEYFALNLASISWSSDSMYFSCSLFLSSRYINSCTVAPVIVIPILGSTYFYIDRTTWRDAPINISSSMVTIPVLDLHITLSYVPKSRYSLISGISHVITYNGLCMFEYLE